MISITKHIIIFSLFFYCFCQRLYAVSPEVVIASPKDSVITSRAVVSVEWTVDGDFQDSATTEELHIGKNFITRTFHSDDEAYTSDTICVYRSCGGVCLAANVLPSAGPDTFYTNQEKIDYQISIEGDTLVRTEKEVKAGLQIFNSDYEDVEGATVSIEKPVIGDYETPSITLPEKAVIYKPSNSEVKLQDITISDDYGIDSALANVSIYSTSGVRQIRVALELASGSYVGGFTLNHNESATISVHAWDKAKNHESVDAGSTGSIDSTGPAITPLKAEQISRSGPEVNFNRIEVEDTSGILSVFGIVRDTAGNGSSFELSKISNDTGLYNGTIHINDPLPVQLELLIVATDTLGNLSDTLRQGFVTRDIIAPHFNIDSLRFRSGTSHHVLSINVKDGIPKFTIIEGNTPPLQVSYQYYQQLPEPKTISGAFELVATNEWEAKLKTDITNVHALIIITATDNDNNQKVDTSYFKGPVEYDNDTFSSEKGEWHFIALPFDIPFEQLSEYIVGTGNHHIFTAGENDYIELTEESAGNTLKAGTGFLFGAVSKSFRFPSVKDNSITTSDKASQQIYPRLTVQKGWNIIGSPFHATVQVNLDESQPIIQEWTGSNWKKTDVLQPYTGYMYYSKKKDTLNLTDTNLKPLYKTSTAPRHLIIQERHSGAQVYFSNWHAPTRLAPAPQLSAELYISKNQEKFLAHRLKDASITTICFKNPSAQKIRFLLNDGLPERHTLINTNTYETAIGKDIELDAGTHQFLMLTGSQQFISQSIQTLKSKQYPRLINDPRNKAFALLYPPHFMGFSYQLRWTLKAVNGASVRGGIFKNNTKHTYAYPAIPTTGHYILSITLDTFNKHWTFPVSY